jgi:hypothetical protein
MCKSLLIAVVVLLAACAETPTAPEASATKAGPLTSIVLDTTATGTCCGGTQQYVPYKPQPKSPSVPSPCPFLLSVSCK